MPMLGFPGGSAALDAVLPGARLLFGPCEGTVRILGCTADWRTCRPGDAFVAWTGPVEDGHDLAHRAVRRGAAVVVTERLLPLHVPQLVVEDSRAAYARICHALAGFPSRALTTVAVYGDEGRSSLLALMHAVWTAAGQTADQPLTTWPADAEPLGETTTSHTPRPAAATLAERLARAHSAGCSAALIPLSDRLLAQRQAEGLELDAVVIAPRPRSAGGGPTWRQSLRWLTRLWPQLKPHGVVVASADDPWGRRLALPPRRRMFGVHHPAEITAEVLERWPSEQTFLLSIGDEAAVVRTPIVGDRHLADCLAAAAAAHSCGIGLHSIVRGLEVVTCLPRRMERIECGQPFSVYLEAAATPAALAQAIREVRQVVPGRTLVVCTPSPSLPASQRPLLGRVLERTAHHVILAGADASAAQPLGALHDVLDGFERPHRACLIPNRAKAITYALALARAGDGVLVVGDEPLGGTALDERQVIRAWLYAQAAAEAPRRRLRIVR